MPREGNKFVGATLPEEWEVKFKAVCQKTSESKVNFMKRVIDNELAIIEGREEDVRHTIDNVIQKKLDIIISKIDRSKIDYINITSQISGIRNAILYLIKVTLRSIYILVGHLHITTQMEKNEYNTFRQSAERKAQQEFGNCMSAIESNNSDLINEMLLKNKQE